jgi:dolichol-phosphate mannosyltransferase
MNKVLVFIPTYNERGNVQRLYQEIKKLPYDLDILFCDDNSPDRTGELIDSLIAADSSVKVIHRPSKMGLGTAHIEAFKYAREHAYDYLITMDADFTHNPSYIPALIMKKDRADIVIGSRYISGGKMEGWNKIRLPFTYFWRSMIKYGLGMPYDCTGAFRLYNVKILNPDLFKKLTSQGFAFCMESLYRFKHNGAQIVEVPILARNRQEGKSKLSGKIMREVAKKYFCLLADRLFFCDKKIS